MFNAVFAFERGHDRAQIEISAVDDNTVVIDLFITGPSVGNAEGFIGQCDEFTGRFSLSTALHTARLWSLDLVDDGFLPAFNSPLEAAEEDFPCEDCTECRGGNCAYCGEPLDENLPECQTGACSGEEEE